MSLTDNSNNNNSVGSSRAKFYFSENMDEDQDDDSPKILEESQNKMWSKLDAQINSQKLIDFDTAHLANDNDKGTEVAWNEMIYYKNRPALNRFADQATLASIIDKLKPILDFLMKIDHPNLLKFYDYWSSEDAEVYKLVVITGYSSAGSLKKLLDSSRATQTKIKEHTIKRWLNQIIYTIKSLHDNKITIFQGHLNSDTIFIQSCGVIRLSPTLLSLNGLCELSNQLIQSSVEKKAHIDLNDEMVKKDLKAIGRLAIDIFTAHLRLTPSSPLKSNHRSCILKKTQLKKNLKNRRFAATISVFYYFL
ncbi:nuclear receptor-binding -like, partial [Brachionus plicatilis]